MGDMQGFDGDGGNRTRERFPPKNGELIDALMAEVLAQMSIVSEQQAHSYDGPRVHGGEKDRAPKSLLDKPMIDYYRDRFNRASPGSRRRILLEAVEALKIARRTPLPTGMEPEVGSAQWKRYIAESTEDSKTLASRFWSPRTEDIVTTRYINKIRKAYRDAA